MIALTQGQTAENIVVTLTELATIPEPYFLFIFTHSTTREQVAVVYSSTDDNSDYPERYNEFVINTQAVFGAYIPGEWHYMVYQNTTNSTNPAGLIILEYGKMWLYPASPFEYKKYSSPTTYKAYAG